MNKTKWETAWEEARSDAGSHEVKTHVRLAAICWDVPGEQGP